MDPLPPLRLSSRKVFGELLAVSLHTISLLRCDAPKIDQEREYATAVRDYEGRMASNPGVGKWLPDAFIV